MEILSLSTSNSTAEILLKLNLPDHSNLTPAESNSLPQAHAQATKTYNKHQDSRIKKAPELKTKTSATLIFKIFLEVLGLPSLVYSKDKLCSACEKGKHKRASFKTKQNFSIKKCLHLLHMDLFRPVIPISINHEKYTLVIVDKYSRTDNGTEFRNSELESFCDEKGISQNLSSPYTPEQNGVAKRKNITLIEAAETMLNGSVYSKHFWTEVVRIAYFTLTDQSFSKDIIRLPMRYSEKGFLISTIFMFTNTSVYQIRIDDSSRYPPDEFAQEDDPSIQYQANSEFSYYIIPHGRSLTEFTQENHVPKVIAPNEQDNPHTEDVEGPPDLINTKGTQELNVQDEHINHQLTEETSRNNTKTSVPITEPLVPEVPQSQDTNHASKSMLTRSMAAKLRAASTSECLFTNFLSEIELKKSRLLFHSLYGKIAICSKWVFRNKKDEHGIVTKNKARLVAQCYNQEEGIDYDETFAPVTRMEAIRIFLAFSTYMNFIVFQMDVESSLVNGKLKEEVFVKQPPGFKSSEFPNYVCKLDKALYRLKQPLRTWYETLYAFLIKNKFVKGRIDNTLFFYRSKGEVLLVQVYVDDIIFVSTSYKLCKQFEKLMTKKFEMSMMGELTYFLELQIKQDDKGISICQEHYTRNLLKKYKISDSSLLISGQSKRITPNSCEKNLQVPERKNTSGACQILGGKQVCWSAKKQQSVAMSSTEAEYVTARCCANILCTYESHPSLEAVKAEMDKIATDEVLVNRTPVLKTAFPVTWRILFTFVFQDPSKLSDIELKASMIVVNNLETLVSPLPFSGKKKKSVTPPKWVASENCYKEEVSDCGFHSPPDEGTRKSQLLQEGKTTDPKDLRGNNQPADKGLHSMVPNEGTGKSTPFSKEPHKDKDTERLKPLVDMESQTPPVIDLSGTNANLQLLLIFKLFWEPLMMILNKTKTEASDLESSSCSESLKPYDNYMPITERKLDAIKEGPALNKKVLEATKAYTKNSPYFTKLLSLLKGFDFLVLKYSIESIQAVALRQDEHLAKWDKSSTYMAWSLGPRLTNIKLTQAAIKFDASLLLLSQAVCQQQHLISLKVQQLLGENFAHTATTDPPSYTKGEKAYMDTKETVGKEQPKEHDVEKSMQEPIRASRPIPISVVRPLMRPAPKLEMMRSTSRIQLIDTILEIPIPQPTGPVIDITLPEQPKSLLVAPKADRGKEIATDDVESPKKLVKASSKVSPDLNEPVRVPYEIHRKLYHLTNDEIQEHLDKEEKMKKATKEAKLLAMSKPELIKVVHEEASKLEHSQKVKKAMELRKKDSINILISVYKGTDRRNFEVHNPFKFGNFGITELDELGPIIQKKKNKIVGELMTSLGKRYEILMKILEELGIQSALPAPAQATSQPSGRKRKIMELEPEIRIPGLECNMSLPEGVLFVNNMVIEEPEYGMFFIDVFGDEAF
ncbi:retrovirus-related pol polyprotein from transposon TNT 1-94 [Tanacetum coccineum]